MKSFDAYHPGASLIYFFAAIIVSMMHPGPVITVLSLFGALMYSAAISDTADFFRSIKFYVILIALITLTNPLFSHRGATVLFTLFNKNITLESLLYGFFSSMMIISVLIWFQCFCFIFTADKIMCVLGKRTSKIVLIISMVIRYTPMLKKRYHELMRYHSNERGMKGRLKLFSALVGWSLEKSIETADSMQARGFGTGQRTSFSVYKLGTADIKVAAASLLLFCFTVIAVISGKLDYSFYPEIKITLNYRYFIVSLLFLLPVTNDIMENIKWKLLKQKI